MGTFIDNGNVITNVKLSKNKNEPFSIKNDAKYITDYFGADTYYTKVYNSLLLHEYKSQDKILKELGVDSNQISGAFTKLRRKGFISSKGAKSNRQWIKYPIDNPLNPPQPDIKKSPTIKGKKTSDQIIAEIENELQIMIKHLKKRV